MEMKNTNLVARELKEECIKGILINVDVNGSYNIIRKAVPNAFANGIEGVGLHPLVVKL
jgi:hypothetical protein